MIGEPAEVVAFSIMQVAISVCELSKNYPQFRDKIVTVRAFITTACARSAHRSAVTAYGRRLSISKQRVTGYGPL
jgi:hypothetical protein